MLRTIFLSALLLLVANTAQSAKILKSTAKKAIIDLEGSEFIVGDQVFAIVDGKKKGLLEITEVKGGKALANIKKGKAEIGADVQVRAGKSKPDGEKSSASADPNKVLMGGLVGYSYDSQTVSQRNDSGSSTESVTLTGTGYSVKGFVDMPIVDRLGMLARGGLEQFSVSGTSSRSLCTNKTTCKTDITYLTGDLLLRYNFADSGTIPYAAAGMGVHYPIAKTSTSLVENNISGTTVFFITGGLNWELSPGSYIPIVLEYGYFPKTNEVSTYMINARIGYGILF